MASLDQWTITGWAAWENNTPIRLPSAS